MNGNNMKLGKKATNTIVDVRKEFFINNTWVLIELFFVLMVGRLSRESNSMCDWLIFNSVALRISAFNTILFE